MISLNRSRSRRHSARGTPSRSADQRGLVEPIVEQDAVGQTRQEVVERLTLERLQMGHSLADVAKNGHPMRGSFLAGRHGGQRQLERIGGAVAAARVHLSLEPTAFRERRPQRLERIAVGFRDPENLRRFAEHIGGRKTGQACKSFVGEDDARLRSSRFGGQNENAFDGVVDRGFQERERLLHALPFGYHGRKRDRRHRGHSHECLQKDERLVVGPAPKGTEAVQRPPDRDSRQENDGGRRFSLPKPERGPEQKRDANELERIVLGREGQGDGKDRGTDEDQRQKQERRLQDLLAIPGPQSDEASDSREETRERRRARRPRRPTTRSSRSI